ncbi:unnamed protein product [Amoebophrya sp. A25]|nr:unnamed protein product [Amoebophrya sp. A25]|eukprot:GSA25T00026826001.1
MTASSKLLLLPLLAPRKRQLLARKRRLRRITTVKATMSQSSDSDSDEKEADETANKDDDAASEKSKSKTRDPNKSDSDDSDSSSDDEDNDDPMRQARKQLRKQASAEAISEEEAKKNLEKKAKQLSSTSSSNAALDDALANKNLSKKELKKLKKQAEKEQLAQKEALVNASCVERFLNDVEQDMQCLEYLNGPSQGTAEWFVENGKNTWACRFDVPTQCCPCKILLSEIIKKLLQEMYAQDDRAKGIVKVNVLEDKGAVIVETEGVNLKAMYNLPGELALGSLDYNSLDTNDIATILDLYGVEAARNAVVKEIRNVFGHYGIAVDLRHLYLIADYMTQQGGYRPFNRKGMSDISSPFLQMTYETSLGFAAQAASEGMTDSLKSASAAIIAGKVPSVGTGAFDLLQDFTRPQARAADEHHTRLPNLESKKFFCESDSEDEDRTTSGLTTLHPGTTTIRDVHANSDEEMECGNAARAQDDSDSEGDIYGMGR